MNIPLVNCLPKTYAISSIRQETAHVKTFSFDVSFGAKPGQFLMVWLPGVDEVPMSIAMDDGKRTSVTFFDVGDMTKELCTRKVGDYVGLRGPFGTHYEWENGAHLFLVAGGYGAAPMYFTAKESMKNDCTIDFIVGARSTEHLLYIDEIESLSQTTLHIATDDGSRGYKGYNTEILEQLLAKKKGTVFACGPELMLKRISEICTDRIPCALSLERYMKCGYGLCGNCCIDPIGIRLCTDGPVVKNTVCMNIEEFGKYHRDDLGKKHPF